MKDLAKLLPVLSEGDGLVCRMRSYQRLALVVILVPVLAMGALTATAEAPTAPMSAPTNYYVAPNGNNANPGTLDQPWKTIQKAANTVGGGDTVYVRGGTYNEQVIPRESGSAAAGYITYAAYNQEVVTIDGSGLSLGSHDGLFWINGKSYIRVLGLRVINAHGGIDTAGIRVDDSSNIILSGNYTYDTQSSGIGIWGSNNIVVDGNEIELACNGGAEELLSIDTSDQVEVMNNHVHHGFNSPYGGEGINVKNGSSNVKVHNNVVHDLEKLAFGLDAWTAHTYNVEYYSNVSYNTAHGIIISSEQGGLAENVKVYNNISYNIRSAGFSIPWWSGTKDGTKRNVQFFNNTSYNNGYGIRIESPLNENVVIRNNIFSQNGTNVSIVSGATGQTTVDHNVFYGSGGSYGSSAVVGDPKFVNPSAADFHLQADSPAIDAGADVELGVDFEGNPRPQGAGFDIGAYEYQGGQPQPTATSTATPTETSTATATSTATSTSTRAPTFTPTRTPTQSPTNTPTTTSTPTGTPTPTITTTASSTSTSTPTSSPTRTATSTSTSTPTSTITSIVTASPTLTQTATPSPSSTSTTTPTTNPNEIVIDDTDTGFSSSFSQDPWQEYTQAGGRHFGESHLYNALPGTGQDTATWAFAVPRAGSYEVYAWWWDGRWRPPDVPYTVNHLGGSTTVRVDQQINGGQWNLLGTFDFQEQGSVMVGDDVSWGHDIVADAVRLVFVQPLPSATGTDTPTPSPSPTQTPETAWTSTATSTSTSTSTPIPTTGLSELVVDNTSSGFSTSFGQDMWQPYWQMGGRHYGGSHVYNRRKGTGQDTAVWSFTVPQPGAYQVYAWWWDGRWRPPDVPYTVNHLGGSTTVRVNQRVLGGRWNLLGVFSFQDHGSVVVSDDVSSGHDIVADAIRLVYLGPELPSGNYRQFFPVAHSRSR